MKLQFNPIYTLFTLLSAPCIIFAEGESPPMQTFEEVLSTAPDEISQPTLEILGANPETSESLSEEVLSTAPDEISQPTLEILAEKPETSESLKEQVKNEPAQPSSSSPPATAKKEEKRWYIEAAPGFYYFTDSSMREFFGNHGFTFRGEMGYRFWKPLSVWIDGGYFEKKGNAIGGSSKIRIRLATLTLGLKAFWDPHEVVSLFAGVGPRIFAMLLHNDCAFVTGDDNQIGIGGGFDGGIRLFPFPKNRDIFFDFLVDYSWKKLKTEEDENCSHNFDVDVSGLTGAIGLGFRF